MTIALLVPAVEAAAFTVGCALIHAQRRHTERLTGILTLVALVLVLGIVIMATPVDLLNVAAAAEATADFGD